MNKTTEKRLEALILRLEEISKELSETGWLDDEIETLQFQFDSKSEKWQESDKGEAAQDVLNELQSACDFITQASDSAAEAAQAITDAFGVMGGE